MGQTVSGTGRIAAAELEAESAVGHIDHKLPVIT